MCFRLLNVVKKYENGNVAIDCLSLQIAKTGMVAFIGASGSGKTTLLNMLSLNDTITEGSIEYCGLQLCKENKKKIIEDFAYIYQDYKLIENMTVAQNLKIAMELVGNNNIDEAIEEVLCKVGLQDMAGEKVLNLSAGQKQRVAIARGLVRNPKVLFADEPTGNLDKENTKIILELLKSLSSRMLVLIVTHDVDGIVPYADRIIKINYGQIESDSGEETNYVDSQSNLDGIVSKAKPKLSAKSNIVILKSLNSAKKGRKIAFSIIIVLLISLLIPLSSWSMIDYNKVAVATLNTKANTKAMLIEARTKKIAEDDSGYTNYLSKVELTSLQDYIKDNAMGTTAKVVDISRAQPINDFYDKTRTVDKNGNSLSIAHVNAFTKTQYVILSDEPTDVGINIIKGEAPKNKYEFAISSGMYEYLNAVGCIRNPDISAPNKYIDMDGESIIGKDLCGVKIVGVFEDNFDIPAKYYEYSCDNTQTATLKKLGNDYEKMLKELQVQLFGNILCRTVIASPSMDGYYDDTACLATINDDEYIQATLGVQAKSRSINIAPITDNTTIFTQGESISPGQVLVPKDIADNMSIATGDNVRLSTKREVAPDSGFPIVLGEISNKTYIAVVSNKVKHVFLNAQDYINIVDDYKISNPTIYYYKSLIGERDLSKIEKYIIDKYDVNAEDIVMNFDYSSSVRTDYNQAKSLSVIACVALAIIAAICFLLAYSIVDTNIHSKANELLILKTLGASRVQLGKIYCVSIFIRMACEMIVGCIFGGLILLGLNSILSNMLATMTVMIPFVPVSLLIWTAMIIGVNSCALIIGLLRINDNNLRKSFQKTKE